MALQATARAAFAAIAAAVPNAVVTVQYEGESCQGVRRSNSAGTSFTQFGEQGMTTGAVYVDASAITQPGRGKTITVDGETAFVTEVMTDPAGALLRISYTDQRPVEGV